MPKVEHRLVDVDAADLLPVPGPADASVLDAQDRDALVEVQLGRHRPQVFQVGLAVRLIDEPDVDLPVVPLL
jgi:hypothetical protein